MALSDRILKEGVHAGAFVVSEANGYRSREQIDIAAAQELVPGQVIEGGAGGWTAFSGATAPGASIGILLDYVVTATGQTAKATVFTRDCEVNGGELVWDTSLGTSELAAGIAGLAAAGIIVRPPIDNLYPGTPTSA